MSAAPPNGKMAASGRIHIFLPQLAKRSGELDKERPVLVYCATGYRASLAAEHPSAGGFP